MSPHPNGIDAASFTTLRLASGAAWGVDSIRGKGADNATRVTAETAQLSVPVIAALGGIVFLGEAVTLRFALASAAILGGVALVILRAPSRRG